MNISTFKITDSPTATPAARHRVVEDTLAVARALAERGVRAGLVGVLEVQRVGVVAQRQPVRPDVVAGLVEVREVEDPTERLA